MKSPGESGSASSAKARMPPQCAWPSTTMCLTFSACTANSSAADTRALRAVRRVGRHQIGDVAHHEQLARPRVEDHLRRHPRVAAADHHDFRRLPAFGEFAIAVLLALQAAGAERAVAFDQMRSGNVISHARTVSSITPRSPSASRTRRAAADRETAAPSPAMDAPRDRGAGERVEQIVRAGAFGGGAFTAACRQSRRRSAVCGAARGPARRHGSSPSSARRARARR